MADLNDLVLPNATPTEKGQGHIDDHARVSTWLLRLREIIPGLNNALDTLGTRVGGVDERVSALGVQAGDTATRLDDLSASVTESDTAQQGQLDDLTGMVLNAGGTEVKGLYDATKTYRVGDVVSYGGRVYQALTDLTAPPALAANPLTANSLGLVSTPGSTGTPTFDANGGIGFNVTSASAGLHVIPDRAAARPNGTQFSARVSITSAGSPSGWSTMAIGAVASLTASTDPTPPAGLDHVRFATNGTLWYLQRYYGPSSAVVSGNNGTLPTPFRGGYADITLTVLANGSLTVAVAVNGAAPVNISSWPTSDLTFSSGAGVAYSIASHNTAGSDRFSHLRIAPLTSVFTSPLVAQTVVSGGTGLPSAFPPAAFTALSGIPLPSTAPTAGQVLTARSSTPGDVSWQAGGAPRTAWTALPLSNGTVHGTAPAQYRLNGDVVEIRGNVNNMNVTTSPVAVFTLPVGFRPPQVVTTRSMTFWNNVFNRLDVTTAGVGQITATQPASGQTINLDGISFSITA